MGKTTKRNCSRKNKSMKKRKGGEGPFSSSSSSGNPVNQSKENQLENPEAVVPVPIEPISNPAPKKWWEFWKSSNPPSSTGGKKNKKSKRKSSKK